MTAPSTRFDVVVLGGGPAGAATAIALAQRGGCRVLLVEPRGPDTVRLGESVPPATALLLVRLGVWERFIEDGHEPCLGSGSSWGDDELGFNDFVVDPHGRGWHLERGRFDALLAARASACGVERWVGARFVDAERDAGEHALHVQLEEGRRSVVRARFVVDATGTSARFARAMGSRQRVHDRVSTVTAFLSLLPGSVLSRLTLLEGTERGWWYAARLPDERVAVAVATDHATLRSLGLRSPEGFAAELARTRHVGRALGERVAPASRLWPRKALSCWTEPAAGDDWLAVGDAAAAYDPLCSQGIYKALCDGLEAADAIARALAGDAAAVRAYGARVRERFGAYVRVRAQLYQVERRWNDAPFWRARRAADRANSMSSAPAVGLAFT